VRAQQQGLLVRGFAPSQLHCVNCLTHCVDWGDGEVGAADVSNLCHAPNGLLNLAQTPASRISLTSPLYSQIGQI